MTRWSRALIALIVASTAAFAVGVAIERHQRTIEAAPHAGGANSESASQRAAETGGDGNALEGSHAGETGTAAGSQCGHSDSFETLLGIDRESTGLVAVAVIVSLLLARAAWRAAGVWYVLGAKRAAVPLGTRAVLAQVARTLSRQRATRPNRWPRDAR